MNIFDAWCDGGVIDRNPSSTGGTFGFVIVNEKGISIHADSGSFQPEDMHVAQVTNNQSELLAMVMTLEWAQDHHIGLRYLYSDSQITLGRVFDGWAMNNVPRWLLRAVADINLNGTEGKFVRGHSGDKWNELCDTMCQREAVRARRKL